MVTNYEFEQHVRTAFAFIADSAAPRVVNTPTQSQAFGDNFMSLEGDEMRVRVVLDREQYLVDLSPLSPDWFDLDVILRYVTGSTDARDASPNALLPLPQQAARVQRHYDAIIRAFHADAWPQTRAHVSALQAVRGRALFPDERA